MKETTVSFFPLLPSNQSLCTGYMKRLMVISRQGHTFYLQLIATADLRQRFEKISNSNGQ